MTTFAVVNNSDLLPAVNYLLSNLDTNTGGNIALPGNVLVANTTTGVISQSGNTTPVGYLYQYVNIRYSNNAIGTDGFSTSSNNFAYFGVYNSAGPTPSANPVSYQWYQVSPPFDLATSRTLYYSAIGGRQIQFAAASSPPSSSYVITVANVAIDLDIVTTAAGTPGERGPIAMAFVITTADPNTATSAQLTTWFEASREAVTPPIGTGLTPVVGDTATFTYTGGVGQPSATFSYNGSIWLPVDGQVVNGNVIIQNTLAANAIITGSITATQIAAGTITATQIAANTITANRIATGTLTTNLFTANTINANILQANTFVANTISGNAIVANTFTANSISGAAIIGGSITTDKLAANVLTANTVISTGATIGDFNSTGFWLQGNTGNARFGNTVSIGNQLTVGANATIGGNLTVSGLVVQGSLDSNTVNTTNMVSLSVTNTAFADANPSPTQIVYTNDANLYPNNTRGLAVPNGIAINPSTTSATQGSRILVTYQTYISSAADSQYNLVELWKETTSYSSQYNLINMTKSYPMGNTSAAGAGQNIFVATGSNGAVIYNKDGSGTSWINASNANITNTWSAVEMYANVFSGPGGSEGGNYILNTFDASGVYWAKSAANTSDATTAINSVFSGINTYNNGTGTTINDAVLLTAGTATNPYMSSAQQPHLYVGNSGTIYRSSGWLTGNTWTGNTTAETSGVVTDLAAVSVNRTPDFPPNLTNMNLVAVGAQGTIITNSRSINGTTGALISTTGWSSRISNTVQNLNGVSYSDQDTLWMAVGNQGTVLTSSGSTGATWTTKTSPTTANLNDVTLFPNVNSPFTQYWIAAGDGGTILVSTDSGDSWTSISNPASDGSLGFIRNLTALQTSFTTFAKFVLVCGQGVIMRSEMPFTTWTVVYDAGFVQNPALQRVEYYGSYANVFTVTEPSTTQRLANNQVITGTYIDSEFTANVPVKYYVYAGSLLANNAVFVQGSTVTATEFKR